MIKEQYELEADNVRNRINSILREKRLTENAVAAGDAAAQSRLNSQLSHGKRITLDTVLRIIDACPDMSAEWLLRGRGGMLLSYPEGGSMLCEDAVGYGAAKIENNKNSNIGNQVNDGAVIIRLLAQLEEKDRQIAARDGQITNLIELLKK